MTSDRTLLVTSESEPAAGGDLGGVRVDPDIGSRLADLRALAAHGRVDESRHADSHAVTWIQQPQSPQDLWQKDGHSKISFFSDSLYQCLFIQFMVTGFGAVAG